MSKKLISLVILLALSVLLGCTLFEEPRFSNLPSEERDDMKLSLTNIDCSKNRTVIEAQFSFRIERDLEENRLPSAGTYQALLINPEGYIYLPIESSVGMPYYDETTNRIVVQLEEVVEGNACKADSLTFELVLELLDIPTDSPIVINLSNRKIGDEWVVNEEMNINGLSVILETARLTTRHQLRNDELFEYPALEIHVSAEVGEDLEIRCLSVDFPPNESRPYAGGSVGCQSTNGLVTTYTMLGEPVPEGEPIIFPDTTTEFIVKGDLILTESWRLRLYSNNEG
jgi:hypothetical protein